MSENERRAGRKRSAAVGLILLSCTFIAIVAIVGRLRESETRDLDSPPLTKPLHVRLVTPEAYAELLEALRTFHYRAQPGEVQRVHEIFFDTSDGRLLRDGSRLRLRLMGSTKEPERARVLLERRPTNGQGDRYRFDLSTEAVGALVIDGWEAALDELDSGVSDPLREALGGLGAPAQDMTPWLEGEIERRSFEVTDKGRTWFELRHERSTYRMVGRDESKSDVSFEEVWIDTRLRGHDPELLRRVDSMRNLVQMVHGVVPIDGSARERAIALLTEVESER